MATGPALLEGKFELRRIRIAAAAGMSLVIGGVGVSHAAGPVVAAPSAATVAPSAAPQISVDGASPLHTLAARAQQLVENDPDFAGITLDPAHDSTNVYLTGAPSATAIGRALAGLSSAVHVLPAKHSQVDLQKLLRRVETSDPFAGTGSTLTAMEPDPTGSGLKVWVDKVTPAAQAAVAALGGDVELGQRDKAVSLSRRADSPAFFGGDMLTSHGGNCTGIPVVDSASKTYFLTARHCFGSGYAVYQGLSGDSNRPLVGTVTQISLTTDAFPIDAELIPANTSTNIWTTATATAPVSGWEQDYQGDTNVCIDGAFEGEVCGVTVLNVGLNLYNVYDELRNSYYNVFGTTEGSETGTVLAGQGDSGGPVYKHHSSGTLGVRGMIEAALTPLDGSTACPSGTIDAAKRICSDHVAWVQMGHIDYKWGVNPY